MTITAEPTKCKRNMSDSRATDIATTARYSAYVLFKEKRYLLTHSATKQVTKDYNFPHVIVPYTAYEGQHYDNYKLLWNKILVCYTIMQ